MAEDEPVYEPKDELSNGDISTENAPSNREIAAKEVAAKEVAAEEVAAKDEPEYEPYATTWDPDCEDL